MTSAILQYIAVITMLIDHIGYRFFPYQSGWRMVGRLSFPIFAFMLAEGFLRTSDRKRYALRLALFAVASEAPYQWFSQGGLGRALPWGNVLFELLLAFAALCCAEKGKAWLCGAALLALAAEFGGFMYGAYGILLAVAFYAFRKKRWAGMLSLGVLTALYCLSRGSWFQIYAVAAAVPLFLYSGQRGRRLPRYFCYAFYPIHLAALAGINMLL